MRTTNKILLSIMLMLLCAKGFASDNTDIGTATCQVLKMGAGARASGLGNAYTCLSDNADAVYWNPACLRSQEGNSVQFMHTMWFEGVNYEWAAFAHNVGDILTFGVGIQHLSYGEIPMIDETGLETGGCLNPADTVIILSNAIDILGVSVGVSLKSISSKIHMSADAHALDFGVYCDKLKILGKSIPMGIVARNIGGNMKFTHKNEKLPMDLRAGLSYGLLKTDNNILLLSADVSFPSDNSINYCFGAEYGRSIVEDIGVTLRFGYNSKTKDINSLGGLTTGIGIRYSLFQLDYSFVPYGDLGTAHRASLSIDF